MPTTITRALTRIGCITALAALLAGVPWLLATTAGWPLPDHVPTLTELGDTLSGPLPDHVHLDAAALAGWAAWVWFTAHVVLEAAYSRSSTPRPALGGGPLRTLATLLVAGVLAWPTGAATAAPAAAAPAITSGTPVRAAVSGVGEQVAVAPVAQQQAPAQPSPHTVAASGRDHTIRFVVKGDTYSVIVRKGDTLSKIAKQWLGDSDRWPEICKLNWHRHFPRVGGTLRDCDLIYPRWDLRLPDDAKPPTGAQPRPASRPAQQPPPPSQPEPSPRAPGPAEAPPTAAPRTPAPTSPSITPSPPAMSGPAAPAPAAPSQAKTPMPQPTGTALPEDPDGVIDEQTEPTAQSPSAPAGADQTAQGSVFDGIHLPDGSILPAATALGLLAAAALLLMRRRRRYEPGLHNPAHTARPDADLAPLPSLITEIKAWLARRTGRDTDTSIDAQPAGVDEVQDADDPTTSPGGTALSGPGAHGAARAALITALTAGVEADEQTVTVTTATTLASLLGTEALDVTASPRLVIAADLYEASSTVQAMLLARNRALYDYDAADLQALHAEHPSAEPVPPLLLLLDAPSPDSREGRLLTPLITVAATLDTTALLLGQWPTAKTWHVEADGAAQLAGELEAATRTMATLSADNTLDALRMLHETHTGDPAHPAPRPSGADDQRLSTDLENPADNSTPEVKAQVTVLGAVRVLGLDDDAPHFRAKAAELLAYLALKRDGVSTDTLGAALYPASRRKQAAVSVQQCVSNLRKVLAYARGNDEDCILRTGDVYRLDPGRVDVDWWQLMYLRDLAAATTDPTERIELLRHACQISGPQLATDHDADWLADGYTETVRRRTVDVHATLAELLLDTEPDTVVELMTRALEHDPYDEHLYRMLMRTHHALGDIAAVNSTVRRATAALAEISAEPGEQTLQLARELRTQHRP
ncbi:BTAD domain-containing putative transcriptional regulator [Catellatospora paridis]|uniref:BTAD domain-containing putative transcriptional regulator n=1 Tax=Catellatospora paridis TaxID=1617086 RepID=UPI0012D497B1|nr:BTAD domain-containing putative transcriptional regulator [Catellatospora paridis]